ncbi:hypothetical protein GCM10028783_43160 [Modestobacter muralis]
MHKSGGSAAAPGDRRRGHLADRLGTQQRLVDRVVIGKLRRAQTIQRLHGALDEPDRGGHVLEQVSLLWVLDQLL